MINLLSSGIYGRLWRFVFIFFLSIHPALAQKSIPELWEQRVHDEADVLNQETIDKLEGQLKAFEDSTSNQIGILIIQSLEGDVLETYTLRAAEKWKLGTKANDNGVLFVVAVDDHKMRIEVGQGLQGVLTDALCSKIIRNEVAPAFRRNDYDEGVIKAIGAITESIKGEYHVEEEAEDDTWWIVFGIVFALVCIGALVHSFANDWRGISADPATDQSDTSSSSTTSSSAWSSSSLFSSSSDSSSRRSGGGGGSFDGGGSSGSW